MIERLVGAMEIGADARIALAGLAHAALAPYYDRLDVAPTRLLAALAGEMTDSSTELGMAQAVMAGDAVAGLLVAYPAAELRSRQQASLFHLLGTNAGEDDAILAAAGEQSANLPAISSDTYYLARIAVAPEFRGSGLAEKMLALLDGRIPPRIQVTLHVHRDNARAIRFYCRAGFRRTDDGDLPFQAYARMR